MGWLVVLGVAACANDPINPSGITWGHDNPGAKLAEGGEIRHENVRMLGMPEQTWVMAYQYTGPGLDQTAPFATPDLTSPFGPCVDERTAPTWPFAPITGATYLDLPTVSLTGPGIIGALNLLRTDPTSRCSPIPPPGRCSSASRTSRARRRSRRP